MKKEIDYLPISRKKSNGCTVSYKFTKIKMILEDRNEGFFLQFTILIEDKDDAENEKTELKIKINQFFPINFFFFMDILIFFCNLFQIFRYFTY